MKIQTKRLLKLAKHLESGKLGVDRFDFSVIHEEDSCGSAGCALGECPEVWPKIWERDGWSVCLRGRKGVGLYSFRASDEFFGLTSRRTDHLFNPYTQNLKWGKKLVNDATPKQVAKNIRRFVKLAEAGKL